MPALSAFRRVGGSAVGMASRAGRGMARAGGRMAGTRAGGFVGGRLGALAGIGTAGYFGYKAMEGFAGQVVPASIDAAMDVAFDDPQADRSVIGTDLTPSIYLGARGPAGVRGFARAKNATRFGVGVVSPVRSGIGGGVIGGLGGGVIGGAVGFAKGGTRGAITGGLIGALGGGAAGTAVGAAVPATMAYKTAQMNSQVINQSPFYNQSALTANRLNASGNIVLGMHNQRRG